VNFEGRGIKAKKAIKGENQNISADYRFPGPTA
jgi:hypothetical protein